MSLLLLEKDTTGLDMDGHDEDIQNEQEQQPLIMQRIHSRSIEYDDIDEEKARN